LSELQGSLFIRTGAKNKCWQTGWRAATYFRLPTHSSTRFAVQVGRWQNQKPGPVN